MATSRENAAAVTPIRGGINFNEFQERVNSVTVNYKNGKGSFNVGIRYYPGRFNNEAAQRTRLVRTGDQADDEGYLTATEFVDETLIDMIQEWDMWDGVPGGEGSRRYEPAEIMDKLEIGFKNAVMEAIQKDVNPGEVKRPR